MRRLRPFTALLVSLFLGQLVLVEAGFACAAPSSMPGMAMGEAPMSSMAGMSRADTKSVSRGDAEAAEGRQAEDRPSDGSAPGCDFPWAPNGCQSMVPCAPPTLGEAHAVSLARPAVASGIARLDVLTPPSLLTPPEPPPPRA